MFTKILLIHVLFSLMVGVYLFATIIRIAVDIHRDYPDYRSTASSLAAVCSCIQIVIVSFIPLLNFAIFYACVFCYDELKDSMEERIIK